MNSELEGQATRNSPSGVRFAPPIEDQLSRSDLPENSSRPRCMASRAASWAGRFVTRTRTGGVYAQCDFLRGSSRGKSRPQKPPSMYGIHPGPGFWKVSVKRNKPRWTKEFAFSTHGGAEFALAMAQAWRDEMARRHRIPGVRCELWPDGRPRVWSACLAKGPAPPAR